MGTATRPGGSHSINSRFYPLLRKLRISVVFWLLFLSTWYALLATGVINPVRLPYPHTVVLAISEALTKGYPRGTGLVEHTLASLWLVLRGFVIGVSVAIVIGLPIGWYPFLQRIFEPIITVGRALPAVALLPMAIIFFGIGDTSKIFIIVYGCFWVALTNSIAGVNSVEPTLIRVARNYGASTGQILTTVVFPAALPSILSGVRVAYGLAYMVVLAAELLGSVKGLGFVISDARGVYRMDMVFTGMVVIGLIGVLTTYMLWDFLERLLIRWSHVSSENDEPKRR